MKDVMDFVLQDMAEGKDLSSEILNVREKLENLKHTYGAARPFVFAKKDELEDLYASGQITKRTTPIGTIEFVSEFLRVVFKMTYPAPLEIPEALRLPHLLLRDYDIVPYDKIPKVGRYFVKNVSTPKAFCFCGDMEAMFKEKENFLDKSALYQVSSILNLQAEYRVFVSRDKVRSIQFYDGDPLIMPTQAEIKKIREAVLRFSLISDRPKAYTIDVGIVKTDNEVGRGLVLIECHPFSSVGTYGFDGPFMLMVYQDGFEWLVRNGREETKK